MHPFHLHRFVFALSAALLFMGQAEAAGRCDLGRCYSAQDAATQQRIRNGATVVLTEPDPSSPFEKVYVLKQVRGVDAELLAGMFATFEEHPVNIEAVREAALVRDSGGAVVVRYELDVKRLLGDAGGLASKAPVSRYAVANRYERRADGSYLLWWEIDVAETERLNPRKGLLGGLTANLGEPAHIHGYLLVEPVPGTPDVVLTYANYVVPKSGMARAAAGTLNKSSRLVLEAFVERIAGWAGRTASAAAATQQRYRNRICELLLTR